MKCIANILTLAVLLAAMVCAHPPVNAVDLLDDPLLHRDGSQFTGGGAGQFGGTFFGTHSVNMVYAKSSGASAKITTVFSLDRLPTTAQFLNLTGRDDDATGECPIEIRLNGTVLFKGPSGFREDAFETKSFQIPDGALRAGTNELLIHNGAESGEAGQPPWFMVARCIIAPKGFSIAAWKRQNVTDFQVRLPEKADSFLERHAGKGPPQGAFAIRGTKGFSWTPEQYLEEIPTLARFRMNFVMNCYLSMFSNPMGPQGGPGIKNEWWLPIPEAKKQDYEKVFETARRNKIDYCFAMHPQLFSPRPLNPNSNDDFEKFWPHFDWAQSKGVRWFSVPLDDVHIGGAIRIDGAEHSRFVNKLFLRLRKKDPGAQLIFCPTWYWGDGTNPGHRPYLEALARDLHPEIYVFWTGPEVVPARITRRQAETFKGIVRHRVILWENYPVNDGALALHLGPVVGRDRELGSVLDGIMSNPHFTENQINRLPLFTVADYAFDPHNYDPLASSGQAIFHEATTPTQRAALRDLIELFPGRVPNTSHNAVLAEYKRIAAAPHSRYIAALYLRHVEDVARGLKTEFSGKYGAADVTLQKTIDQMRSEYAAQYEQP